MDAPTAGPESGAPLFDGHRSALHADLMRVRALAAAVAGAGGRALVVGGYARDEALRRGGRPVASRDVDVEVFGLSFEELRPLLAVAGEIDVVGAAFQVAKI
ncbi:MAG TPA: hypothetical protein VFO60_08905, partial [Candidatus Dormibacteraeota bacterium]|nr:hypothetical protein [Candidatus Dormibacteraeota bacterium]